MNVVLHGKLLIDVFPLSIIDFVIPRYGSSFFGFITSISLENKTANEDLRFTILRVLNQSYSYFLYQNYSLASDFLIETNRQFTLAQDEGLSFISSSLDMSDVIKTIKSLVETYTVDISRGVEGTALAVLGGTIDRDDSNYQFDLQRFTNIITRYSFQKRYFTQSDLNALYV